MVTLEQMAADIRAHSGEYPQTRLYPFGVNNDAKEVCILGLLCEIYAPETVAELCGLDLRMWHMTNAIVDHLTSAVGLPLDKTVRIPGIGLCMTLWMALYQANDGILYDQNPNTPVAMPFDDIAKLIEKVTLC